MWRLGDEYRMKNATNEEKDRFLGVRRENAGANKIFWREHHHDRFTLWTYMGELVVGSDGSQCDQR